tara:strand:- start:13 stop:357 length:345 start_codon:yes stop_codon:yes gene_type:complete
MTMAIKALVAGLMYDVVGQVRRTEEGQLFEESPWDKFQLARLIGQGLVEETTTLETSEPKVEVLEEVEEEPEVEAEEELLDLTKLSAKELRALCKERDLDTSGKKSELIARLEE